MTNAEMKTVLTKSGVSAEVAEKVSDKYDFEKITELIDASNGPEAAMEAIHNFYPEIEVSKLQEQMDFVQGQFESAYNEQKNKETIELTESELDHVSGGGFSDWWNNLGKGWKVAITIATCVVVATAATTALFATGGAVAGLFGAGSGVLAEAATGAIAGAVGGSLGTTALMGLFETCAALGSENGAFTF